MAKYFRIYLFFSLLLSGCTGVVTNSGKQLSEQDSLHYKSIIMTVLANNINYMVPDYAHEGELIFNDNSFYLYKSTKVLRKYLKRDTMNGFSGFKEVIDTALHLTMRIHRWNCGCEISLPNTILYVSNRNDFEYGFVFFDESRTRTNDTLSENRHPTGPPTLEFQVNFMLNALHLNLVQSGSYAEHFLFLITDSLLGLEHISLADIPAIEREVGKYAEGQRGDTACNVCKNGIAMQMNQMIKELKSGNTNVLYYKSSTKYFPGFWCFEFTVRNGRRYVNAKFNKFICNKLFTKSLISH